MLTPLHSSISPQTCYRFFGALARAEDAVTATGTIEKSKAEYLITNLFSANPSDGVTDCSENIKFAKDCLEKLLKFAIDPTADELTIFDNKDKKFFFSKKDGMILCNEYSYPVTVGPFLISDEYEKTHCQIPIGALLLTIDELRSSEKRIVGHPLNSESPKNNDNQLVKLVRNNDLQRIEPSKLRSKDAPYSNHLVLSDSKQQCWNERHHLEISRWQKPEFPIEVSYDHEDISEDHRNFLKDGTLPKKNEDIGKLFVELCRFEDPKYSNCCRNFLLKNINVLTLTSQHLQTDSGFDVSTFVNVCDFVKSHFEGNNLIFVGFSLCTHTNHPNYVEDTKIASAISLLLHNPNLKSLRFDSSDLGILFRFLQQSIEHNDTLVEFNISGCEINDYNCDDLVDFIRKSRSLKVLNLEGSNITDMTAQRLMWNSSISSLNLKNNPGLGEQFIFYKLLENTTLTSFKFDWSDENVEPCDAHLKTNLFNQNRDAYHNRFLFMNSELPNEMLLPEILGEISTYLKLVIQNNAAQM